MKMCSIYFFIVFSSVFFLQSGSSNVETYYLDELCNSTVRIRTTAQAKVKATRSSAYDNNMDCRVSFIGAYRFMIEFKDLDMERGDKLRLIGELSDTQIRGTAFTGYSTPSTIYTTSSSSLHLTFTSDFAVPGVGFYIVLTQFTFEPCDKSMEYKCNTNQCVNSTVECGYLNPCPSKYCPVTEAAGIAMTILIIVAVICAVLCAVCGVYLRHRRIFRNRRHTPVGVVAVVNTHHLIQAPPPQPAQPIQPPPYSPQAVGSAHYPQMPQPYSPHGQSVQNPTYGQPTQQPMQHQPYGQPTQNQLYGQTLPNGQPMQNQAYGQSAQNQAFNQPVKNQTYDKPVQKPGLYILDAEGKEIDPRSLTK